MLTLESSTANGIPSNETPYSPTNDICDIEHGENSTARKRHKYQMCGVQSRELKIIMPKA